MGRIIEFVIILCFLLLFVALYVKIVGNKDKKK